MEFHINPPNLNRPNGLNKAGGESVRVGEDEVTGAVDGTRTRTRFPPTGWSASDISSGAHQTGRVCQFRHYRTNSIIT